MAKATILDRLAGAMKTLDNALKGLRRNRQDYGSAYLEEIWPE